MTMRHQLGMLAIMVAIALPVAGWNPEVIWIEAERFNETGGWVHDWQFMDTMGSP